MQISPFAFYRGTASIMAADLAITPTGGLTVRLVNVGSAGTRCFVLLLEGRDSADPLLLQVMEASASVLEAHLHASQCPHHGERVVQGQRQIQAQSDICWVGRRERKGATSTSANCGIGNVPSMSRPHRLRTSTSTRDCAARSWRVATLDPVTP